jgi:hypothetical protein
MPQIPVRCSCGTCQEWALIEFQVRAFSLVRTSDVARMALSNSACIFASQGEVGCSTDDSLDGLSVGTLCLTAPVRFALLCAHSDLAFVQQWC